MTTEDVDRSAGTGIRSLAERLFRECGDLPPSAVFAAIGRARAALRDRDCLPPDPRLLEALARADLRACARARRAPDRSGPGRRAPDRS